jgi:hypothetical protein
MISSPYTFDRVIDELASDFQYTHLVVPSGVEDEVT